MTYICHWSQHQRDTAKPKPPTRQMHVLRHDRSPWNKHTDPPTSSHRTSSFVNFSNTDAYPQTVSWASIGLCCVHDFWYLAASQSRYHNFASILKQRVYVWIVSGSHTHVKIGTQRVLIHMNCVPAPPSLQRLYVSPMHIYYFHRAHTLLVLLFYMHVIIRKETCLENRWLLHMLLTSAEASVVHIRNMKSKIT